MDTSASYPLGGAARTLASAARSFLLPGFCAATGNFAANLGIVRAKARIRQLTLVCLVHQIYINRGFEDRGGKFHFAKLFTFEVENVYFHLIKSFAPTACAPL